VAALEDRLAHQIHELGDSSHVGARGVGDGAEVDVEAAGDDDDDDYDDDAETFTP
jgi:hypothetical protein